jgi:hypothetical protein
MFKKSLVAAFAAAAMASLFVTSAPALAEGPHPATTQTAIPAVASRPSPLSVGGPSLPAALAGRLLTREGWAPIATGQDGAKSRMVVLRKEGTDQVRLVEVANGTLKVTAEGTADYFKKPAGPFGTVSFDPGTMTPTVIPVDAPADASAPRACFNDAATIKDKLLSQAGEMSILRITGAAGVLDITTGINGGNTWTVLETKTGQSQTCMINYGVDFRVSDIYPLAHWAPAAHPAPSPASEQNAAPVTSLMDTQSKPANIKAPLSL